MYLCTSELSDKLKMLAKFVQNDYPSPALIIDTLTARHIFVRTGYPSLVQIDPFSRFLVEKNDSKAVI